MMARALPLRGDPLTAISVVVSRFGTALSRRWAVLYESSFAHRAAPRALALLSALAFALAALHSKQATSSCNRQLLRSFPHFLSERSETVSETHGLLGY